MVTDWQPRRLFVFTSAVLTVSLLLGGAGTSYPLVGAVVQIAGLGLICYMAGARLPLATTRFERIGAVLALVILAVPLVQLVPVPPPLWMSLPGRQLVVEVFQAANISPPWAPISLDADATARSALELLPPLALFWATLRLTHRDKFRLLYIIVGVAAFSAFIGALQKATNGADLVTLFASGHQGDGTGLFVNRNHQATFLLMAMLVTAAFSRLVADTTRGLRLGVIALAAVFVFSAGVIATTSRMGLAILPLVVLASLLALYPVRFSLKYMIGGTLALGSATALVVQSSAARLVFARLEGGIEDIRYRYWEDTLGAISEYGPVGSGVGSFPRVFPIFESLDAVSSNFVANAHNDYLELLLETGAAGALLMVATALYLAASTLVGISSRSAADRATRLAIAAALCVTMLHSVVDYPLRMMSISSLFAVLAAYLVSTAPGEGRNGTKAGDESVLRRSLRRESA